MSVEAYGTGAILGYIIGVMAMAVGVGYRDPLIIVGGTAFLASALVCTAHVIVATRRATAPPSHEEPDQEIHTEPGA